MTELLKNRWWQRLRWPLTIGLLSWLILPNFDLLRSLLEKGIDWRWLALAFVLRFGSLLLTGFRWKLLLQGQNVRPPTARLTQIVGIGYVSNFFLPGTIGGDVVKAGLIAAETPETRKRAIATVPLDRALGLLAFVMLGSAIGLLRWNEIPSQLLRVAVLLMVGISCLGLVGLLLAISMNFNLGRTSPQTEREMRSRVEKLLLEMRKVVGVLQRSRQSVLVAILLGMMGHVSLCSATYCCLRALPAADFPLAWTDSFWVVPGAEVPVAFLSLPGGLGAREGALSYFFGEFAVNPSQTEAFRGVGVLVGCCFSLVSIGLAVTIGTTLLLLRQTASDATKSCTDSVA